jgi:hypothetical protein
MPIADEISQAPVKASRRPRRRAVAESDDQKTERCPEYRQSGTPLRGVSGKNDRGLRRPPASPDFVAIGERRHGGGMSAVRATSRCVNMINASQRAATATSKIIEEMADPIVVVKPDYRVELVNRQLASFQQARRADVTPSPSSAVLRRR